MISQQIVLARPVESRPVAADFRLEETQVPRPREGELLIRTLYLSLDPYVGSVLRGRHMGERPPAVGDPIPGRGLGEVIESRAPGFSPGDLVRVESGWRSHVAAPAATAERIDAGDCPLSAQLGAAGMPGLTAWAGMKRLAEVKPGDDVLVSSAAGAVGGTAGQIARILGAARVVGVAGGSEKCRLVTSGYGFDDCIDYKAPDWKDRLQAAFPRGVGVYFDNVGGETLAAALAALANYGRVVLCGLASQYHADARPAGPNPGIFIARRAKVMGLVVYDFLGEQAAFTRMAGAWMREGRLRYAEDRVEGLAAAPALFEKLVRGDNVGKAIVVVDGRRG